MACLSVEERPFEERQISVVGQFEGYGLQPVRRPYNVTRVLEQKHDFHAQNDWIEGADFLRKSTLESRGFGYTYRGFAIAPEGKISN
ncbi:MAG: hypothetical protein ACP5FH_11595 [Terracidiphilus sp.]